MSLRQIRSLVALSSKSNSRESVTAWAVPCFVIWLKNGCHTRQYNHNIDRST